MLLLAGAVALAPLAGTRRVISPGLVEQQW